VDPGPAVIDHSDTASKVITHVICDGRAGIAGVCVAEAHDRDTLLTINYVQRVVLTSGWNGVGSMMLEQGVHVHRAFVACAGAYPFLYAKATRVVEIASSD